jgi:chemotaxis methyl-accepting protein methylase/signal transduction histidine kinase
MTLESNSNQIDTAAHEPEVPSGIECDKTASPSVSAITVLSHDRPAVAAAKNDRTAGKPFESKFPVVGVAASAGGLAAFTQLLSHLAVDTGMAFVLIQHLAPDRHSLLSELLAKVTKMQVCEAQHGMAVEPNRVYTIPPNTKMVLLEGALQLSPREKVFGKYMPGDALFTSLAAECGHRAIAIVLSGGDGDGSLGLTAIKAAGGVTFAQCEATANVESMPTSAIATGNVDFVLPPEKIAEELLNLSHNPMFVCPQPLVATDGSSLFHEGYATEQQVDLEQICSLLLATTGIDFSYYKSKTLHRRIGRRMLLCRVAQLADYVVYLEAHPAEINALYAEILIHVTSFFRDPAAFELLKTRVFPTITQNKSAECPIRIWVAGCSTGEEVYSIAMCLLEFLADRVTLPSIQILATDISEPSLDKARAGIYNENQMVDVSPERCRRFFKRQIVSSGGLNERSCYQIDRAVRELCVFTRQDLGSDAADANFDLISCRNVLIYFDESLQQRIMPIFHERLNSTGFLLLGTSESTGKSSDLFAVVERKHQIYVKNSTATQSTRSGIPSSDALPEPLRERTVGSIDTINNLENRQSSLEDLPGCDLQQKVERDLQVANDKILWIEQELQTKHEELKTAKEEIQSTTEELQTIAAELHYRNAQLDRVNNDLTVGGASSQNETLRVGNACALRLRKENRTQDDFLSNLAHELRHPLTAIIGWAQLLQTHKLAAATVTHGLEVIYRSAKVQSQSIDNLLDSQLPLEAVPSDLAIVATETSAIVTQDLSLLEGLHILAVDDEPYILDLVKYILEDAGAQVTTVTSTRDAISSLVTSGVKYDALLSDIGMPNEDGLALIGQVRALDTQGGIPAAAITADASERQRQQAIAAGFQVHLAKPFDAAQLIQMVANLTNN